jgi:hypothetical protein
MTSILQRRSFALLLTLTLAMPAAAQSPRGSTPELEGDLAKLNVPEGHQLAFAVYAEGAQIYRWNGTAWVFVAPDAILFAANQKGIGVVGTHYTGPTWESNSGSKVVATLDQKATPDATSIPWLKLRAVSSEGPGIFNGITYIQRLYTTGGIAPSQAGTVVGEETRVPYTTLYFFYREQH